MGFWCGERPPAFGNELDHPGPVELRLGGELHELAPGVQRDLAAVGVAPVGVGDGRTVGLDVEAERRTEALEGDPAGRARRVDRERAQVGQLARLDHNEVNSSSSIVEGLPMTTKWKSFMYVSATR